MDWFNLDRERWIPGVSRKIICPAAWFLIPRMRLRVVWGLLDMMAIFSPKRKLRRVDFPAFGRPMMETNPDLNPLFPSSGIFSLQKKMKALQGFWGSSLLRFLFALARSHAGHFFLNQYFDTKDFIMVRSELLGQQIPGRRFQRFLGYLLQLGLEILVESFLFGDFQVRGKKFRDYLEGLLKPPV